MLVYKDALQPNMKAATNNRAGQKEPHQKKAKPLEGPERGGFEVGGR